MLLIIGCVVILILFALMGLLMLSQKKMLTPDSVMEFVKANENKQTVSLAVHHNGKKIAEVNGQQAIPVPNVASLILAINYAEQLEAGTLSKEQGVSYDVLENFRVPRLELDRHKDWVNYMKSQRHRKEVPLHEVVRAALIDNSNAASDYLFHVLGAENIQRTQKKLKLMKQDMLYPTTSALFVGESESSLNDMSMAEYRKQAFNVHTAHVEAAPSQAEKAKASKQSTYRIWADRLPKSSTRDFLSMLKKINNRTAFSQEVLNTIEDLFADSGKTPELKKAMAQGGMQTAATASSFAAYLFATDAAGNKTELALFAHHLTPQEFMKLNLSIANFEVQVLNDSVFRERLKMKFD